MEQNNNGKELAKLGAKAMMKAATAPLKAIIMTAIGTILPYILIGAVIFIVILCVYFGTLEQIDEVLDDSSDWGERMGNAISLYGFKTNQELEEDEEGKFYAMQSLYKELFEFDNYELSIMNQTLLYEGSNEERVYLSEYPEGYDPRHPDNSATNITDDNGENKMSFWNFIKNIFTNYQRGFFSTFGGQSQYVKANKNMLVNAAALKKCSNLSEGDIDVEEKCYKGYLVAEYNIVTDFFIDCDPTSPLCDGSKIIESDVEPGFLVLPNNVVGESVGMINKVLDLKNHIENYISSFTIFGGLKQKLNDFEENARDAVTLFALGKLASEDDLHFYYDGYIVNNLKETYKVFKNEGYDDELSMDLGFFDILPFYDKEIVLKERKNRRKTANDIMNMVESYFELTYGYSTFKKSDKFLPSQGSSSFAYGTSCAPISASDLAHFGSPTNSCLLTSCFEVYGGDWGCKSHKGVDVSAPNGIYSVCDGTVTMRGMYQDGSASAVEVKCNINGNLYTVRYLHMPMSSVNKWNVGDKVPKGIYIGEQGAVGNGVEGAHLHLDISLNGSYVNPEALVSNCNFNINCESARNSCNSQGLNYCK